MQLFEKKQTLTLDQLSIRGFGKHWQDERWHEVLRLITGMVGEEKAELLIRFLLQQDGERDGLTNLLLAAECLGEVRNRRAIQAADDLVKSQLLEQANGRNAPLGSARVRSLRLYERGAATRVKAISLLAALWKDKAIHDWLYSAAKKNSDSLVRTTAVQELARVWKEDAETYPLLKDLAHTDKWSALRVAALEQLARRWTDDPETFPMLMNLARAHEDFQLQQSALKELTRGWKEAPESLRLLKELARSDPNWSLRTIALELLTEGWSDDHEVMDMLNTRTHPRTTST